MNEKTILVIDDSATIRKLVDTYLTSVGYRVILAPNAEIGLELAAEIVPDLILLDHQLPGTTGYEVCCKLSESESLCQIPVVVSSTLRKKAYAEYVELNNVVDMLPKPYTEDLLCTTVANAIETASMVVTSQTGGTAVPEVIEAVDEAALSGQFSLFGLRELLDFLNNGCKSGVLEVETAGGRIRFHLDRGRIQGVYASGIAPAEVNAIVSQLPESLKSLASILKMTLGGRSCAEIDGFVQLLDQKILDPRLMTKLLRYQAAMLVGYTFRSKLVSFRFEPEKTRNSLHRKLPLDISLLALLVEAAVHEKGPDVQSEDSRCYVRRVIRGQNLDRAGLSAKHMKILNVLAEPKDAGEMAECLGWEIGEVQQVLRGFILAELVEQKLQAKAGQFVVYEPDATNAQRLRASLDASDLRYAGKVVRDKLALQLVFKRTVPHTIFFSADDEGACDLMQKLFGSQNPKAASIKRIALSGSDTTKDHLDVSDKLGFHLDAVIDRSSGAENLYRCMDRLFEAGPLQDDEGQSVNRPLHQDERKLESVRPAVNFRSYCQSVAGGRQ